MGLYPEGKDPDSPPSSSPSFALQAASSPSLSADNPRTRSLPFLCRLLSPAPDSVVRMKQSATQSQFLFSLFLSFSLYVRRVGSQALLSLSFTPSLCSQATTQLKWFAAAKKISLFSPHSRSLAAPPSSPLSLSLTCPFSLSHSLTRLLARSFSPSPSLPALLLFVFEFSSVCSVSCTGIKTQEVLQSCWFPLSKKKRKNT